MSELLSADSLAVADYTDESIASVLAAAQMLLVEAAWDKMPARKPIRSNREAAAFLRVLIGFRSDEALVILFLDTARGLIDHEIVAVGRADAVEFDQRRILMRAMSRGAAGIIVAHNHPSGDATPSQQDYRATRRLADVARELGICLHDHLVVAGGEVKSALYGV